MSNVGDVDEMAKQVFYLIEKEERLMKFKDQARERASAFSLGAVLPLYEKLYDKVADYLKGYAKEKGYKMVLTYSKGNSAILFADESLDVTKEVIKGLNEAYKSDKK